ncbi:MAG: cardiolipin synthase [Polyangiaceae bacterium]
MLPNLIAALGLAAEIVGILLVLVVLLQRKEPPSTVAWILVLLFLPGVGAVLFLMFGRQRVRTPLRSKVAADRELAELRAPASMRARGQKAAARAAAQAASKGDRPLGLSEAHDGREGDRPLGLSEAHDGREGDRPLGLSDELVASHVLRDLFHVSRALGAEPSHGNDVELLVDGEATYASLEAAINAAKHHVLAEYYLLRPDPTTDWFLDLLARAARRGVRVKLLIDGYGSFWISRRRLSALRAAGGEVVFFLPARLILFQPMNLRNHRKIVVVDGETAFTGGINIGDEYQGKHGPWRDAHLRIAGPAVLPLSLVFAQDWRFAARRDVPPEDIERAGHAPTKGSATVAIVRSGPDIPGPERETIHRVLFSAITSAERSVYITTPYFIPDRSIVVALQTAAYRGVDVRILFPSKSNHPFVFQAGRSFYEELLSAGVKIFEYGPGMIHAKTMVVDGSVSLVGSANMDLRSFRLNFEVHAVIDAPSLAVELTGSFESDLTVSKRIDLDEFRGRGAHLKVVEAAARLLSPLM